MLSVAYKQLPRFLRPIFMLSPDDSGGEFDVNGNPREDAGSGNDNRLEKYQPSRSNFPSSFPELSNLQHLSRSSREAEAEQRSRHSEKKGGIRAYKESNKNIRTQQKSDQVLGYRGNTEDVEGLVNFIEGGNKKKKKLTPGAAQTNTQNVPVAKTTSKKTKKKAGSGLKAGEADEVKAADEELGEHDVIDDTEKIRAVQEEVDLHVQQVKDMVVNTSQDLQLTNNNNKQKPGRSMSVESNNSIKSTGSKPDSYRQVTPARETAKQRYTPNREMLSLDDNPTHHSSRDPANKMRGNRNNYMFTDTIVSPMPREEEFTVVNKKKKRVIGKEGSVSTPQQNTFHNGGYNNNIGGGLIPAAARYAYTNREHVTRDTTRGRYSPVAVQTPGIQRSVTPPPNLPMNTENTVHVPGQEQRTRERAFSPSGFPVLGGARHHERRNSTGTVPAELTTTGSVDMDSEDVESVKSLPTTVPPVQPKPEQSVGAAGAVSPRAATVSYAKVAAQPRNGSNKPGAASCSDTTLSQKCEDLSTPELAHVQSAPDMAHVDSTNAMGDSNLSSWPPVGAQPATSIVHSDAFVCDNRTEHRIYPTPDLSKPPPPIPTTICSQSPPNFTPIQPHHPHHTTTTTTNLCTATHTVNKTHKFKGGVFINSDLFVPNQTNIGISFGFDMEDDSCVNNSVNNKTSVSTTNFVKIATEPGNGLPLVVASKVVDISPVRTPVSSPPVEMASITDISAIDNGKQDASLRQNIFPPANADDLATGASITFGYVESVCEKTETDVDIEADIDMSPKTEPGKDDTRMPPDGAEGQPEGGDSTQPRTQPRSMSPPPTPVIPILDNDDKKCDTEIIPEPVPPEPPITMPMPPRTPSRSSVSSSGSERTDGGRPHNNHRHRGSSLNNSHNQQDIQAMQQGAQQMQQQAAQFNKGLQNAVNMQHMLNGLLPVQHAMQGAPMFTQHPASAILNYQHAALVAAMAAQNGLHLDPSNMYRPGMPPPTFMPRPHGPPPPHAQPPHMHPQQMQVMPPNSMPGLMGQIPPPHMVMTTHPHQAHIMQAALSAPPPTLPQPPTSLAMPIPPATPPRPHSRSNPPSVEASPVSNNNNDKNKNTQEQENANRDNNQNSCSTEERASSPEQVSSGEPAPNTDIKLASKVKQSPLDWFPEYSSPESDPNFNAGKFNHKDAVTYLSREWDKVMEQKNNYPNSVVYYSEQLHA